MFAFCGRFGAGSLAHANEEERSVKRCDWVGSYRPLHAGAEYLTFGSDSDRVLLVGGGCLDVYTDGYGDQPDFLHFQDSFVGSVPSVALFESVVIDRAAVRRILPGKLDELDPDYDEPPFRTVAEGLKRWRVELRSGRSMLVLAHRWRRQGLGRLVFDVLTVGGRPPEVLPLLSITRWSVRSIEEVELVAPGDYEY
ncbi:hypothetical protein [Leifsonia sp. NPDC080035]|uniref:Uncharacterized protein n=1 Tax=Leifsonia sp. NPDC080035 TaxID=3143936 RepID=A0AAU7GH57_9MICO